MKNLLKLGTISMVLIALLTVSCKKDEDPVEEPDHDHEEETITTLTLTFVEDGNTSNTFSATFADPDGDGGNAPTVDNITLEAGKTYNVSTTVLNESENPAEDLTPEIQAEQDEHLFCYVVNSGDYTVNYLDADGNGLPVGLASQWVVGQTTSTTAGITISLKHQPGIKDGTCAPGETDVEASFAITIQ